MLPIDTLSHSIPWLPLDASSSPGVQFVGFNLLKPPLNNVLIRNAFVYATDRKPLLDMVRRYGARDAQEAMTLTHPETLGRDLYGEVGISFDPQKAQDLLLQVGYTDLSAFPTLTFVVSASGDIFPGYRFNMANAMAEMWQQYLGVSVEVEAITSFEAYLERLRTDPPDLFWFAWSADINDPDNFLYEIFHSDSQYNYGRFASLDFDRLVEEARSITDPARRQELYIQAERLLCEEEAGLIPIYHRKYENP